jgi:hypothetical protein
MRPPHAGFCCGITAPHGAAMLLRSGGRTLSAVLVVATLAEGDALGVADVVGKSIALLEGDGGLAAALVLGATATGDETSRAAAGSLLASP